MVDRTSVITTHIADVVNTHAARLLGREDVRLLTDVVKRTHPVVVEELTPTQLSLGEVQRVLQSLLEEGVSIRDLVRIFEAISMRAQSSKDLDGLVDSARTALGPAIVSTHLQGDTVHVISLDPRLEQRMLESLRPTEMGLTLAVDPELGQSVLNQLATLSRQAEDQNLRPVLVCAPQVRSAVRRMIRPSLPALPVLAYQELLGTAQVRSVGVVSEAAMAIQS